MQHTEIIQFWYKELQPNQWFNGGDEVDRMIQERFSSTLEQAHQGLRDEWATEAEGRLALLLVLDQFPRNIYRNTARAFAYDEKARTIALDGIALGVDEQLSLHQRAFYYLPLEHSENLELQDRSLERYSTLVLQTPGHGKSAARRYLDYAWRHYQIIKRFGRYPHRNKILGRESTPKELKFLKEPGSSF